MSTKVAYPVLVAAIDELRRRWRLRALLAGGLLATAGVTAALLAAVAADNLLQPGTAGRSLLAILVWGTLVVATLRWVVQRWLEDRRDDFFAAMLERSHPTLRNRLISALQLGRVDQPGSSPELIHALVNDAAGATAEIDPADGLDPAPARRAGAIAAAAALLLLTYALVLTPRFANGLARVLLPTAEIAPFTATRVLDDSVRPGDARVVEGTAITVRARVEGVVPGEAQLVRRAGPDPGKAPTLTMEPTQAGLFGVLLPPAADSFDYQVIAGDGRSRTFHVEVVKRPRVRSIGLKYTPPDYTGRPPRQVADSDGAIAALPGTAVALTVAASKPLKEATLTTEQGLVLPLVKAEGGREWTAAFRLDARAGREGPAPGHRLTGPSRYRIRLVDTEGFDNADGTWRPIVPVQDQPPSLSISKPGRDLAVKPDAAIALSIDARDDHGLGPVRLHFRVNDETRARELAAFPHDGPPSLQTADHYEWTLSSRGLKAGDLVQYWATAEDRNTIGGPGRAESRRFTLSLATPEQAVARLDIQIDDYAKMLEALARLQRENRAATASGAAFEPLVARESLIRTKTGQLARAMQSDALPVGTIVDALDALAAGPMAEAIALLESGRDSGGPPRSAAIRQDSLPIQDRIVAALEDLLARLQRNEQAKEALRRMARTDKPAHRATTQALTQMIKDLGRLRDASTELAAKFEAMPKKPVDEFKEEDAGESKDLDDFRKTWEAWAKGTIAELAKLPAGFVDDFQMRPDVNKIFEEVEKAAARPKPQKIEVALEDLGAGLATKMMEDLEMWMPDTPDAAKWVLEEPLDKAGLKVPEMSLPTALEDMVGDLLQKADEFDEEADDITSAWGDNLNQAGWGVGDGPISSFSAKGKTGNDLPNNMEVSGRSGDGRRGKSSGQMVGDTARALEGRKTPARVNNERYEPGKLKQEGRSDPNGSTGGGKKAGSGRKGLQGGTPPDFVRDIGRLNEKQAGLREKAEQVAKKLDPAGSRGRRLGRSIDLMKSAERDLRDLRYEDAARKRKVAIGEMKSALGEGDAATAAQLSRARDLPPQLRNELLEAADEGYPPGYESLLKNYFKALSAAETPANPGTGTR